MYADTKFPPYLSRSGRYPDNAAFANLADLDKDGYIVADENCKTKTEGLFVAGDCRTETRAAGSDRGRGRRDRRDQRLDLFRKFIRFFLRSRRSQF